MDTVVQTRSDTLVLPAEISTLAGFRRWAGSPASPEHSTCWFVNGRVWIDTRPQQLFSEIAVRTAIICELYSLEDDSGEMVLGRGAFWVNEATHVAGNPDGMYVSAAAFESGRVRLLPDPPGDCTEVEGVPDMMLEIARTDAVAIPLCEVYFNAGVPEYWLVDARGKKIEFNIYKRGAKKFIAGKPQRGGWVKSAVFGKSFRLTRGTDATGHPEFTLEVK